MSSKIINMQQRTIESHYKAIAELKQFIHETYELQRDGKDFTAMKAKERKLKEWGLIGE